MKEEDCNKKIKLKYDLKKPTTRKMTLIFITLASFLCLPQPQNAMPVPKIENNSLTSAMVSF